MALTPEDFLLEDYKQKISCLTAHLAGMWTRFNFFVTIESALALSGFNIRVFDVLSIAHKAGGFVWSFTANNLPYDDSRR